MLERSHTVAVGEATVKSHLSHIYTKLGVDTRAVATAIERRILCPCRGIGVFEYDFQQ